VMMTSRSVERQRRYIARIAADPQKRAEFLMKDRQRKQKQVTTVQNVTKHHVITQHGRTDVEMKEPERLVDMPCMLPLCHPFTAVVAGPTGCGKTAWVLRLIDNVREKIEPVPTRIWYCYGEHQPVFNNYPQVHFEDGLPQLNDEVFDGREPTMIVVDDHMFDVNQLVADIFTKISHHRNISILYLTQNLFDKNKYARTISLNAHYLVLFKYRRDAGQFAIFARQMYPTCWKFAVEGYEDATSTPYGYLLVDLKPDQDERYRLRTNFFPGEMQHVYVRK